MNASRIWMFAIGGIFLGGWLMVGPQATASPSPTPADSTMQNDQPDALTMMHGFAPGQRVHLEMNVGDLRVVSSADDHQLRLVIQPERSINSAKMQSWVRQFDITADHATIRLHLPRQGKDSGRVTLYVPSYTAVNADLGVGDLKIDGICGDQDLNVGVGDLTIAAISPKDYGTVSSSVGIGDVQDRIFQGKQEGWLGKSEKALGSGSHHIHAHVGVGDVRFRAASSQGTD